MVSRECTDTYVEPWALIATQPTLFARLVKIIMSYYHLQFDHKLNLLTSLVFLVGC